MTSPCSLVLGKKRVHFPFYFLTLSHTQQTSILGCKPSFEKNMKGHFVDWSSNVGPVYSSCLNHSIMNNSGGNDWTSVFIENWHFLNMKLFLFLCKWSSAFRCSGSVHFTCSVLFKSRLYHWFSPYTTPTLYPAVHFLRVFAQRIFSSLMSLTQHAYFILTVL